MSETADWRLPATACPRLTVHELALRAGRRTLVSALDMTVNAGELWCVVGPNGVGKSTLMSVLAGLRQAEAGQVRLDGDALAALARHAPDDLARRRAYLPQAVHDTFSMSVRDAVRIGRFPHLSGWGWTDLQDEAVVQALLAEFDLLALQARDVMTLSGGERQRVSLATLLAQQAPLLLLDEPLAHLDLRHQIQVLDTLARLARAGRHAVVLIVHDLNLARRYATHALLMGEDGRCLQGPAASVLTPEHCSRALGTTIVSVADGAHTALIANGQNWPTR
ncbi:ABC transporter ATP-binding protein [Cupriavidus sp. AU9028]|uniref:ABC transporter ATP-binding protein n=1 Tax=Cupriavidus sp. AU9028 TaxID=2871157 RepID=UPI001C96E637|nr:ABC transporter ATP-binding protein [Cupriavidus sp. AU9028]MBY4895410.1 ABC transporter ATP-binding protein [Cupriavidus sp. AU9028]